MTAIPLYLALLLGQMIPSQEKPVFHLPPHSSSIDRIYGGRMLKLINAPGVLSLPKQPPLHDLEGKPWEVDVKNLGPNTVTIIGKGNFNLPVSVGQTVHIASNGTAYSQLH